MRQEARPLCRRCGQCCRETFVRYVGEEDLGRWLREKRSDLLGTVRREKEAATAGRIPAACRFLAEAGSSKFLCSIYETRPSVCRDFNPGQAKICPEHPSRVSMQLGLKDLRVTPPTRR